MPGKARLEKTSKFLSYVLRHRPEAIDLTLDANGWAAIAELIEKAGTQNPLDRDLILQVVETSEKKRFALSGDGEKIRANQGHSVKVDLELKRKEPPAVLYHGTATRFLASILREGLRPRRRHHVHLSSDSDTAVKVGQRHGEPVVLRVAAAEMAAEGYAFFRSENGVWLADSVPPAFLSSTDLG